MDKFKETFGKFRETVKTKWTDMGKKGHIIFFSVLGVIVVSLAVTIILASKTDYAVLYSNASAEERAEVLSIVNGLGATEVTVDDNGDILVPKDEVEQLRVQLSMQGYPKSTFNYDIWDNGVDMFSTDSDKRIKEIQQLQENLRATLAMFDGVDSAIVILTIPEDDNYVIGGTNEEAGASVVLQLEKELSNETIKGIYNLIRTAVPGGLKEENITVTDGSGNLLSYEDMPILNEMTDDEEIQLYYKRLELQNSITSILKEKLDSIFDGVFPDFRVGVDVQLNYDGEKKQKTEYTPSVDEEGNRGGMVDKETAVSAGGGNAAEGGLVGTTVDADISPDYPTLQVGEGDEFYYEWQREIDYLVNEEITQIEKDGYSYDNISATVVVDATGLSQAEIEDWESAIATAIGADFAKVTFKAYPFMLDRTGGGIGDGIGGDGTVVVQGTRNTLIFVIISLGVLLVILLIIALVASGSSKKRAKARREGAMAVTLRPAESTYIEDDEEEMQRRAYEEAAAEMEIQSLTGEGPESREEILKKEIREFSKQNPEIVAQLIRTWMRSEE
ncbi:MAG: flagellar M-ring protein FliF [Ruminiclostridium sp.]|nr:flagellar M-ring protein FliF [Ruminiclostridium sp.]